MSIQLRENVVVIDERLMDNMNNYVIQSKAKNTVRAYKSDWRHFEIWCCQRGLSSLPSSSAVVAMYITSFANDLSVGTLSRRITTIRETHLAADLEPEFMSDARLKALWEGIKRTKGVAQHGKAPLLSDDIRQLIATLPGGIQGLRNRALILFGYSGAFRRSELVALNLSDLKSTANGIEVTIRRSKTDQEGAGMLKAIPYGSSPELCPVRALQAWIGALGRIEGAVFVRIGKGGHLTSDRLSDRSVALIIKQSVRLAGMKDAEFAGHSLRSGFVTQAALSGASDREIMNQTGHKTRTMVDRYVRHISIWQNNAAMRLGL